MAPAQIKPENVLKRADELIALDQKASALQLLHELLLSRRSKNAPISSIEPIALRFVELCVILRKGKIAKEGLFKYKNIAQNSNVSSIGTVLQRYIDLATEKVEEARSKSQQLALELITDLEAASTPESIILSTVSIENSQDRTDRAILTPWLAFLWDSYRISLEIMRNNPRLEVLYQNVAHAAFQFCVTYQRKSEFKRLCELQRNHLQNAAKWLNAPHAIDLSDAETSQRLLDTRFSQLLASIKLELWNEAFRSIEDIHHLLTISKVPPKISIMTVYYENIIKVLTFSDNSLFLASAWSKLASLRSMQNVDFEDQTLADNVVLSALSVPIIPFSKFRNVAIDSDPSRSKDARISVLLRMSSTPTRGSLLAQIATSGILNKVSPQVAALHKALEVEPHTLDLSDVIKEPFRFIYENEAYKIYLDGLQNIVLTTIFQQISRIYKDITLDNVYKLASFEQPYALAPTDLERFIMIGNKEGYFNMHIDHSKGAMNICPDVFVPEKEGVSTTFQTQKTPSEVVRGRLYQISKAFMTVVSIVDRKYQSDLRSLVDKCRDSAIAELPNERDEVMIRRTTIERRKELAEEQRVQKERERQNKAAAQKQHEQEAETRRIQEDARRREAERLRKEKNAIRLEEARKLAEDLKAKGGLREIEIDSLEDLDTSRLRALHIKQLEQDTRDMNKKMMLTGKRLDHIERAFRREELPLLEKDYERQKELDQRNYEEIKEKRIEAARLRHDEDCVLKNRLVRMLGDYQTCRDQLLSNRLSGYEAKKKRAQELLEKAKQDRRQEVRQKIVNEIRTKKQTRAKIRAEAEKIKKVKEEAEEKEAMIRAKLLAHKRERELEKAEYDALAEKQRKRDEEVMARSEKTSKASPLSTAEPYRPVRKWQPKNKT